MITDKEILWVSGEEPAEGQKNRTVLVVDSKSSSLRKVFTKSDYLVVTASSDKQIIEKARKYNPNVLIGDFLFLDIQCEELCYKLKNDSMLGNLPIIMVSTKSNIAERIRTVNGSVDDYIVRPFDDKELLARVNRVINRTEKALNANPLTRLPGNITIRGEIEQRLQSAEKFATCFLDLDNFKAFNDYYGFARGDKAIEMTSRIITQTVQKIKQKNISKDFFIGHIGGDDFVVISPVEEVDALSNTIIKNFDKNIKSLYDHVDLKKEYISSQDRGGLKKKFPLMTISIAIVSNEKRQLIHSAQISQIGSEIKRYIKQFPNSNFLKDRRL